MTAIDLYPFLRPLKLVVGVTRYGRQGAGHNTKYKVVITTGAKDLAGNALDQNPAASGSQPMEWFFTTDSS